MANKDQRREHDPVKPPAPPLRRRVRKKTRGLPSNPQSLSVRAPGLVKPDALGSGPGNRGNPHPDTLDREHSACTQELPTAPRPSQRHQKRQGTPETPGSTQLVANPAPHPTTAAASSREEQLGVLHLESDGEGLPCRPKNCRTQFRVSRRQGPQEGDSILARASQCLHSKGHQIRARIPHPLAVSGPCRGRTIPFGTCPGHFRVGCPSRWHHHIEVHALAVAVCEKPRPDGHARWCRRRRPEQPCPT